MSRVLVTGAAGFVGYHLIERLLAEGRDVLGVDNLQPDYDPSLKAARVARLRAHPGFTFERGDVTDRAAVDALFTESFDLVVHLAARAGVRASVADPRGFVATNVGGMVEVLEGCRRTAVPELVYASSSAVAGMASPYAATKAAGEALAAAWSNLYGLRATGLRLFTVYGPWGRPDMAVWRFTQAILAGKPLPLYNRGEMSRDFTFVGDAVEAVMRLLAAPEPGHRVIDVGTGRSVPLGELVTAIEAATGASARRELLPRQPGDVLHTRADVTRLRALTGYVPPTPLADGVADFVTWYQGVTV